MPRVTKQQRVRDFVASKGWPLVAENEWKELRAALPDISETTLRDTGINIAQPWQGVAQHTLGEMEASLRELSSVYGSRPDLRRYCRDLVIAAKDRARLISRRPRVDENKRRLKAEMVEWMLVWLDDPAMFRAWADVRRNRMGQSA
jgi:hypothetical protein